MRLRPIIGWGVFFFIIALIAHSLPSPTATFYYLKGQQRLGARNYEGAVQAFRQSVTSDPTFARGFIDLGTSYYALEQFSDAEDAFNQAMSIAEDSCAACGLGMVYRVEGRHSDAESILRKSIQLNPSDTCPYNQLGRMYYDAKAYPKAIEAFRELLRLRPNAVTHHFVANSLYRSGQVEESLKSYQEATRLAPNYEEVLVDVARAYSDLGRNAEANEALQKAVKLEPDDQEAHALLGVTEFVSGNRKGAMEQYEWLLMRSPSLAAELMKGLAELSVDVEKLERMQSAKRERLPESVPRRQIPQ